MSDDLTDTEKQEQNFSSIRWNEFRGGLNIDLDIELLQLTKISSDGITFNGAEASDVQKSSFAQTLLNLLANCTEPVVQEFALVRTSQILSADPSSVSFFKSSSGGVDCSALQRILKRGDASVKETAAQATALVLSSAHNDADVQDFLTWALAELGKGGDASSSVVASLMIMLRSREARVLFAQQDGIPLLVQAIDANKGNAQLLYEACFCLWCLTFCDDALATFQNIGAVRALVHQITAAPREKVVRVSIAALLNLLDKNNGAFNEQMIDADILKTLNTLKDRKWADEDITEDVTKVRNALLKNFRELSSVERYEKELKSRTLTKGHLHTEKFWREHVMEFEKENFFLIRELVDLLRIGNDENVAIACYDLGEFVRFYPSGKAVSKNLKAKEAMLPLLDHQNPDIKKEALLAVSKMMVDNWEYVGK